MESQEPRLEVVRLLGEGATARVELVRLLEPWGELAAGSELAKKTLRPGLAREPEAQTALRAEYEAGRAARDRSLVRVLHHGLGDGLPYLLLQYVPGRSLRERLEQHGPLPEPLLRSIGAELARALALLHERDIVHGDVKPENVRLDEDGRAVLLDLGFARRVRGEENRSDAGSLAYLSPERARGEGAGPAADVFALGVVLYELATGRHPFARGQRPAHRLTRSSSSAALARRSIELVGADELLAAIGTARFLAPSRFVPSLSPFLDRCLLEALARSSAERPRARELETRFLQGESGAWWRARIDPARETSEAERGDPFAFPLVGREAELAALNELYRALGAGGMPRAAVAWLVGPEGSGKWRLLGVFAERVRASATPPLLLDARFTEADEGRAAGALLMLLNRWLGLPSGSAPGERELQRLTGLTGATTARALMSALDPRARETIDRSIPSELARWLGLLAAERPLLVFLDDLHQAGAITLGALSTAIELLRSARVLFVLSLREDVSASEPALLARLLERLERGAKSGGAHLSRIELLPLDQAAVGELVARVFHDSAPRTRLAEVLWQRSHGNPGFLTEILRELEARGEIRPVSEEDERFVLTIAPDALPMPRSLDKLITERFQALEPDERNWLEHLSVVGGRLTPEFLLAAFPATRRPEIDDVLARLVRKGWLVPAADRYRFERPALREALYRSLSEARRRRLHVSAARGLAPDEADLEQAYQRAYHLQAAGEHRSLLDCVHRILPPLRRRASAQRLLTLARWGLEALERLPELAGGETLRLELLEDAADAADRLGRREDQRVLLDHLANFEFDPESHSAEAARLYLLHARYAAGTGQFGLARGWLKSATTLAERSKDRWLLSQALRRAAQVQAQIGEFRDARKLARRARTRAVGENQQALAHLALAHVDVLEDEIEGALAEVESASALLRRTTEPRAGVLAYAELLRGRVWRSAGLAHKALGVNQRALLLARRAGERRLEAEALARRGGLLLDLDRPDLAKAELLEARLLSDEIEDRRGQVLSTLWLGLLEAEEGDARAARSIERAVELAAEIGFFRAEALGRALAARLRRLQGDLSGAEAESSHALELVRRHGAELSDRIVIAGTHAFVLRELERAPEARRVLAELEKRTRASQRRLTQVELRDAQRAYAERLLAAVLSGSGPVFPRHQVPELSG